MAEAHQAVAFQFVVTDEGISFHFDKTAVRSALGSFFGIYRKRFVRARNSLYQGIFPASPLSLALIMAAVFTVFLSGRDPTFGVLPWMLEICRWIGYSGSYFTLVFLLSYSSSLWILSSYLQRYSLKILLMYKGWMFDPRGRPSHLTQVWMVLLKLISGRSKPLLYSYQRSLPRLPVPKLASTCRRYLESVRALLSDEDFAEMERLVQDFKNGPGKKLNRYLYLKSWWANNYVTDWWEKYVYLWGRSSIMINSNYYACDNAFHKLTPLQVARAGMVLYVLGRLKQLVEGERLPPLVISGIPLCSAQYERLFCTSRIPGLEADSLAHYSGKEYDYVAVMYCGRWYKVQYKHKNKLLTPIQLEWLIQQILDDVDTDLTPGEKHLPALTTTDRKTWAETRERFFMKGKNKISLETINKAAYVLVLDEGEPCPGNVNDDSTGLSNYCSDLLHGNGHSRWFDKSFNIIVYKNGKLGINAEHSWADAPIIGYLLEFSCNLEHTINYRDDGHNKGDMLFVPKKKPERLRWNIPEEGVSQIEGALVSAQESIANLDLYVILHDAFGKGDVKKCKISPDAFIQMALQLAYFKDSGGNFCLTYEASMTRLYLEGRTETVRPVSVESTAFVRAMCDPNNTDEERRRLLRVATDKHVLLYKLAMTGKGVDRHLFCLYVLSKYFQIESPFLGKVLGEPWRLSTSQTPAQQTGKLDYNKEPDKVSPGGGFGPVTENGYGVSYIIQGDDIIYFHVSSFKSSPDTNSRRFTRHIQNSMRDMRDLFLDKLQS